MKDVIYVRAEVEAERVLRSIGIDYLLDDFGATSLVFEFSVEMVASDIQQIVGRHRREIE